MDLDRQWSNRPDDQRFLTIDELRSAVAARKADSWTSAIATRDLKPVPTASGIVLATPDHPSGSIENLRPSHWAFGQVASYAGAPAGYLRKLPPELAAINLAWGLERMASNENSLVLADASGTLRAMTSQSYGRIWDQEVVDAVIRVNQDGRWQVPAAHQVADRAGHGNGEA